MSNFPNHDDADTMSISTAFTDDRTLVDSNSVYTASEGVDDDTATLLNESFESKQKLAESIVTRSDFLIARIKAVGMNVHPEASDSKQLYSTILSIRYIIRKTREDAINNRSHEQWKIEKSYNDFVQLHAVLQEQGFDQPLPSVYKLTNNSPINCDKRIVLLELYFKQAMAFAYTKDPSYLCAFLSTNVFVETKMKNNSSKEGVLSKYKGFFIGGWKSMYFVLQGTKLEYYSCKGGKLLGSLSLFMAESYKQHFNYHDPDPTTNCRHGLIICAVERKGITDQFVRHQFCAFTDQDRDEWVDLITEAAKTALDEKEPPKTAKAPLLTKLAGRKK